MEAPGPSLTPDLPPLPDLAGEWIGRYPGHFDETVLITQQGDRVEAVKVTGDEHVPAGEITWRADLRTFSGEGQVAEREFHRPRFVPGRLEIVSRDLLVFHWVAVGSVEFRRDD